MDKLLLDEPEADSPSELRTVKMTTLTPIGFVQGKLSLNVVKEALSCCLDMELYHKDNSIYYTAVEHLN